MGSTGTQIRFWVEGNSLKFQIVHLPVEHALTTLVNSHLVYNQLVYYPFRLLTQPRFSGLGLGLGLGVGIRVV